MPTSTTAVVDLQLYKFNMRHHGTVRTIRQLRRKNSLNLHSLHMNMPNRVLEQKSQADCKTS